ncbi:unnamed protein product [Protopolystoma xenopodis]|uniref:Uncharacterized protein n=1 Tax=Protopolystoma xenopodis TaxID=117903 RepID=A0A448XD01_9PLAT|nr:unnamed protein product [Protopolystoma xenopodis]
MTHCLPPTTMIVSLLPILDPSWWTRPTWIRPQAGLTRLHLVVTFRSSRRGSEGFERVCKVHTFFHYPPSLFDTRLFTPMYHRIGCILVNHPTAMGRPCHRRKKHRQGVETGSQATCTYILFPCDSCDFNEEDCPNGIPIASAESPQHSPMKLGPAKSAPLPLSPAVGSMSSGRVEEDICHVPQPLWSFWSALPLLPSKELNHMSVS